MNVVGYYGVHFDQDKVGWLEQGRGGTNAVGLKARSPFTVRLSTSRRHCNHQVPLATPVPNDRHWDIFMELQSDELVRAMMPFPKPDAGLFFLEDGKPQTIEYLVMLSRMTSPIFPTVVPVWTFDDPRELLGALGESNIQPLVLYSASLKDIQFLREVAQPAAIKPRKLIVTGSTDLVPPSMYRRIATQLTTERYNFNELNAMPWETLGAVALRKYLRHEFNAEMRTARASRE